MKKTLEQLTKERQEEFKKIYEETFGEPLNLEEPEKQEGLIEVTTLNIYGIKSKW